MKTKIYLYNCYKQLILILISLIFSVGLTEFSGLLEAADLTRITILPNVKIDDEDIILGKIADIDSHDVQLVKKIRGIVVAKAPLLGKSRILEKRAFEMRLKQNMVDLSLLVLHIPEKVIVTRSFIEISKEKIKILVSNYIQRKYLTETVSGRIKNIKVADSLLLPNGQITFKVIPPRNRNLRGKIPFSIYFDVNGKFYKRVWATATIELMAEVVITKKPMGRHKPITEDDIELVSMDLAKLPTGVVTDPESVLGKRTRRAIGSKTVLRSDLIEFPPLVKRGDVVIILAESNGLKITTMGQVKKKGRLGERIPVMNYDSKKILYARVLDSGTVKVEF
jgi:flagellar basal body P-ring formation protein FlgA